jgi:hypothetical protein
MTDETILVTYKSGTPTGTARIRLEDFDENIHEHASESAEEHEEHKE